MSPLPMRQLNAAGTNLAPRSGIKHTAPAAMDPGEIPLPLQAVVIIITTLSSMS